MAIPEDTAPPLDCEPIAILHGHENRFADGSLLVSASSDQTARAWSVATQECIATFHGHEDYVCDASFSPDNSLVATVLISCDSTARLLKASPLTCAAVLRGHTGWLLGVSFSNGTRVVTASDDTLAHSHVWSVHSLECVAILRGHIDDVSEAFSSPDGSLVVTFSEDGVTKSFTDVLFGRSHGVDDAQFSPGATYVVTAGFDNTERVWSVSNQACVAFLRPLRVVFSRQWEKFTASRDHSILLSDSAFQKKQ